MYDICNCGKESLINREIESSMQPFPIIQNSLRKISAKNPLSAVYNRTIAGVPSGSHLTYTCDYKSNDNKLENYLIKDERSLFNNFSPKKFQLKRKESLGMREIVTQGTES